MPKDFIDESFEHFLKEATDQHRMSPSGAVWKNISANLNNRRRKTFIISGASLLLLFSFGYYLANHPKPIAPLVTAGAKVTPVPNGLHSASANNVSSIKISRQLISGNQNKKRKLFYLPSEDILTNNTEAGLTQKNSTAESSQSSLVSVIADSEPVVSPASIETIKPDHKTDGLLSIESVTNLYKAPRKKAKVSLQLVFTPTVSYRKLSENKSYTRSMPNYNAVFYNVNNVVTHKPDMGLEFGLAAKYPVTKSINIRAGLQFNINRYNIAAFNNYTPEVATIALNTGYSVESLNTLTPYRNVSRTASATPPDWLQAFYFQVSVPVGAEVVLAGSAKTKFGIAGTIQPTYIIGNQAYLLSADYKNYSQVPSLIRRWNVNTSLETFVGYSTGKLKWQIGPQVRYQLLSSFVNKYPVKENLFDFGLKVGVALNNQ